MRTGLDGEPSPWRNTAAELRDSGRWMRRYYGLEAGGPDARAMPSGKGHHRPGGGCCFEPAHWPTSVFLVIMPLLTVAAAGAMVMHIFELIEVLPG
jgi:hypothetical protein